jgi:hypothetical protein
MTATKEDITRLEANIAKAKSETIRWFFAFFVTLTLLIVGLYLKK